MWRTRIETHALALCGDSAMTYVGRPFAAKPSEQSANLGRWRT